MLDATQAELSLAGAPTGVQLPAEDLPQAMVEAAEAFLLERAAQQSEAWRLAELEDGLHRVLARMGLTAAASSGSAAAGALPGAGAPPVLTSSLSSARPEAGVLVGWCWW